MKEGQLKLELPFLRSPYNYDRDAVSWGTALVCEGKSLTLQSQAQEADINVIMKRFGVTGQLPQVAVPPSFGDFDAGDLDYRTALDVIRAADQSFMQLDASVRARFFNDPARFVEFCEDPKNLDEMVRMGLAVRKEPENPPGPTPGAVAPAAAQRAAASSAPAPAKEASTAG